MTSRLVPYPYERMHQYMYGRDGTTDWRARLLAARAVRLGERARLEPRPGAAAYARGVDALSTPLPLSRWAVWQGAAPPWPFTVGLN